MASRRYRVIWTETATRDLQEIVSYIAKDSQQQATKVLKKIRDKSATLRSTPSRRRFVPELLEFDLRSWRELIVSPWRIIYRIEGRLVFVDSVLDGRRDVEDILMQRLLR
jgi:addiction module RelE/StbE family toxin